MSKLCDSFRSARRAGVPLVGVATPDPAATVAGLVGSLNGKRDTVPVVCWDIVRAAVGLNELGAAWVNAVCEGQDSRIVTGNPVEFLALLPKLPEGGLVFVLGASRVLSGTDPAQVLPAIQGVWNLRDALKVNGSTVVLVGPLAWSLPDELRDDVVLLGESLPGENELAGMLAGLVESAGLEALPAETAARAVDAVAGLSSFAAEQCAAMSLGADGLDLGGLWERKRAAIEQTPGLSVWRGGESFADIGGCENVKGFLGRIAAGARAPRCVVFVDEIEKAMSGANVGGGDTSGVSQDFLGVFLREMQDREYTGCILVGPPGSGKSAVAKATGNSAGVPTVAFDMGAMKGSLVGQSEERCRSAWATVNAIGQGRVLVLATCNGIATLPPELRRRFTLGTFFFDLPTAEERSVIWSIYLGKYGREAAEALPVDEGWTGAEIRQCCDVADRLGCSLVDAALYVVPVSRSAADQIDALRRGASGRFLSASAAGVYRFDAVASVAGAGVRRVNVGD